MNRKQRRKETHSKRTVDQLAYQLGVIKKRWQDMLERVEHQSELNPDAMLRNIPAQSFLTDQLADVNEVVGDLEEFGMARDKLAGAVNRLYANLQKFLSEAQAAKGGEK